MTKIELETGGSVWKLMVKPGDRVETGVFTAPDHAAVERPDLTPPHLLRRAERKGPSYGELAEIFKRLYAA